MNFAKRKKDWSSRGSLLKKRLDLKMNKEDKWMERVVKMNKKNNSNKGKKGKLTGITNTRRRRSPAVEVKVSNTMTRKMAMKRKKMPDS